MGLDATAYEMAALLDEHEQTDDCYEDHIRAYVIDPDFHLSLRGLEVDRCYEVTGQTAYVRNSYGGHGRFRETLAQVFLGVNPKAVWSDSTEFVDRPFFELIQFADNQGTIGPEAAADLATDFAEGRGLWRSKVSDEYLLSKYDEWAEVFMVAANGGLVRFA